VTFNGNFSFHPLQGGTVVGMVLTPDPTSPIMPTATGMSATFNLANQGDYGYYCTAHGLTGMMGAIFVVP
jgi:plastocyanin